MNVLHRVTEEFSVDPDRVYLWGHSMGGAGTYHLAARYPNVWAALGVAAPAPSVSPDQLASFRHIPILVLQGGIRTGRCRSRVPGSGWRECGSSAWNTSTSRSRGGDHSAFINADRGMVSKLYSFFDIVRKTQRPETD